MSYALTNTSCGGDAKRRSTPPSSSAVEIGHPDVQEDRVVVLRRGLDERVVAVEGALDVLDMRRAAQQPRQILELRALVIDREDR